MKYQTTVGKVRGLSFEDVLFCAQGEDGGQFMPQTIPLVSLKVLETWKHLSYTEVVKKIVALYVSDDEICEKDQNEIVENALGKFDVPDAVKMVKVSDEISILELGHGKTMAFKDLAMSCTSSFMDYFLKKRKRHFTSLVVTSGDTGSSAIHGALACQNMDIIVVFPYQRISLIQQLMMTTVNSENVHVYSFDGDLQDIDFRICDIYSDATFIKKNDVGTMNSGNWGRILVQIAHHVFAYLQMAHRIGDDVHIVIPSGGYGNLTSCLLAVAMGVPIRPHAISNSNDNFNQLVRKNQLFLKSSVATVAPAMDISFPSNLERIIWILSEKSGSTVSEARTSMFNELQLTLPQELHSKFSSAVKTDSVSDEEILRTMNEIWTKYNYKICPHTATAVSYVLKHPDLKTANAVCLATANPAKFPEILESADVPKVVVKSVYDLTTLPQCHSVLPKGVNLEDTIRNKITAISAKR